MPQAMFRGLEEGIAANDGSASIAFNGGGMRDGMRDGRQLRCSDRMVWGELQEFLRYVFIDCAKIDGRDRRLMAKHPLFEPALHAPLSPHAHAHATRRENEQDEDSEAALPRRAP